MKTRCFIIGLAMLLALSACHTPTREARRMVACAERLADSLPDSTICLIDSVLHMPVNFSERERMDMALLQGEVLFRDAELDDDCDFLDSVATSPELEHAADYYAKKKQYDKASHAALYSGYIQQHYNEKEAAMQSFKVAEHFGGLAADSFTLARAQYKIGRLLFDDYMENEAIVLFKSADFGFGNHYAERAIVQNMEAVLYIVLKQYDSVEMCLKKSLTYAEQSQSTEVKRKALNNYAVLYRLQGKHDLALEFLRQIADEPDLTNAEKILLYLNLGKSFAAMGKTDSVVAYYQRIEDIMPVTNIKTETKVSAYGALSRFAETQGETVKALQYLKTHEELLSEIQSNNEKKTVFRIQHQYDYESLQNEMNQKLIRRQHIVTFFGIFAIIGLAALSVSQIRLAKTRKQEAEARTRLFHFMQQNQELSKKNKEQELQHVYLKHKNIESSQAYNNLLKEKEKLEQTAAEYGEQLSLALKKEQSVMLRLHLFLENQGDEELLKNLEKTVFGKQTHMDAMMNTVDRLYPQLREIVKKEVLGLDENEQMDIIMSYFNVSRQDESLLLKKTTDMVDKIRNRSRKKIKAASEVAKLPKTI